MRPEHCTTPKRWWRWKSAIPASPPARWSRAPSPSAMTVGPTRRRSTSPPRPRIAAGRNSPGSCRSTRIVCASVAPAVGGAFGMKASVYPEEVFAVWAALHHRCDVRWTATRSEEFLSATHGRALTTRGRLALDADGSFTALEAQVVAPVGPWLPNSALVPALNAARILPSGYDIPNVDLATEVRSHPLPPVGIYRGAGRPEANTLIERLIDEAAAVTGRDPLELRRQNMLPAAALPHETLTGDVLDSGDYPGLLTAAEPWYWRAARRTRCPARGGPDLGAWACLLPRAFRRRLGKRARDAARGRQRACGKRVVLAGTGASDGLHADRGRCAGDDTRADHSAGW